MSRLSHRQTKIHKNLIYIGVGILVLFLYLAIFGLNSLINVSLWFGNLVSGNKSQTVEKPSEEFFGALFVDSLPTATNSAELVVSGNSSNFDTIEIMINGKKVEEIEASGQDTFSETIGKLKEGENTIQVVAKSTKYKETKRSDKYIVKYKNKKPKLEISEPSNEATIKGKDVTIKGETDPEVTVEVDGAPVVVNGAGVFQSSVRLKEGDNTIVITAVDDATNEEKIELKLKSEKED